MPSRFTPRFFWTTRSSTQRFYPLTENPRWQTRDGAALDQSIPEVLDRRASCPSHIARVSEVLSQVIILVPYKLYNTIIFCRRSGRSVYQCGPST